MAGKTNLHFGLVGAYSEKNFSVSSLPERLYHPENIHHLIGGANFTAGVDVCGFMESVLRGYSRTVDLLAFAKARHVSDRDVGSVRLRIEVSNGRTVDAKWSQITQPESQWHGDGPRLLLEIVPDAEIHTCIDVPLQAILWNAPTCRGTYTIYAHQIGKSEDDAKWYVGLTRRSWIMRWQEHRHRARSEAPYLFHRALREVSGLGRYHRVLATGLDFDRAMMAEESFVKLLSLYPFGLNMIPGGYAGLKYLADHGFHPGRKQWERRERIIEAFSANCTRMGRPNPLAAGYWRDDSFAAKVICSNPNNFSVREVHEMRFLHSLGWAADEIAIRASYRPSRVLRLVTGSTYSRVK